MVLAGNRQQPLSKLYPSGTRLNLQEEDHQKPNAEALMENPLMLVEGHRAEKGSFLEGGQEDLLGPEVHLEKRQNTCESHTLKTQVHSACLRLQLNCNTREHISSTLNILLQDPYTTHE